MRRLAGIALAVGAAIVAVATLGATSRATPMYRVDALFDNADYLVPGQEVKVAGAVVGDVVGLHVTADHKARVELEVQPGFAPFRSDASCEIRPESLIGEKFVQCDPGTPRGAMLAASGGRTPTVPLANDHSPVDLDLVLSALRLPFRERLAVLVNELGTGLAGRPADLNAAIRRANPAIDQAHRVLTILAADRQTLGSLIDASDSALAQLAAHRGDVASFIDRANSVAGALASRSGDLGESIHRLPPLLAQLEPAAVELTGFSNDARPVANELRGAAAPVNRLLGDLGPLTDAARPTLVRLGELSRTGLRTVSDTMPVARSLLSATAEMPPLVSLTRQLVESLQSKGAVEGLLTFLYNATESEARFDQTSHILPSYLLFSTCSQYATTPASGCSARWGADAGAPAVPSIKAGAGPQRRPKSSAPPQSAPQAAAPRPPAPTPAAPTGAPTAPAPAPAPAPSAPSLPPAPTVQQLLNYLLAP